MVKIMTPEEHEEHEHLCGRTGVEVSLNSKCDSCDDFIRCAMDHATYIPPGIPLERFLELYPVIILQLDTLRRARTNHGYPWTQ